MFDRWGRFVVRRAWWVIGGWLVGAFLIIGLLPSLSEITSGDQGSFLPDSYESVQAIELATKAFPEQATSTAVVVVKRTDGGELTAADQQKTQALATAIGDAHIAGVGQPLTGPQAVAPNKTVQLISIPVTAAATDAEGQLNAVKQTRDVIKTQLAGTALSAGVAGQVAQIVDNNDTFTTAFTVVGTATFVLIIVLILIIFRSPIAALLPIVVISVVMQVSSNLIAAAGELFDFNVDQSLQTLLLIVLYGIGTDYLLFLLFRYREQLRAGADKKTAMVHAVARVGEVITSAAAAVIVAFLVLLLASFGGFGSLGPALAIAVFVMLVTGLTLIPALVSLIGPATFWPSKAWKREPKGTRFARIGAAVGRRPAVAAAASGLVLVALASGVLLFKADYDFAAGFPSTTESAKAAADLERGFPQGALDPTEAYLTTTGGGKLTDAQLAEFGAAAAKVDGVGAVQPPVKNADGTVARFGLLLTVNPASNEAITLVHDHLRDDLHGIAPPGTKVLVGGTTALFADINSANNRDLSVILPVAALLIAIILGLLLRSVVAPVYLVLAVLLNFAATLGAAVYLFQGVADRPGVTFQLPIVLYLFVLAIGTDYNILMIARLREEARAGNEPRDAAALAIQHGGPSVAAAGVILAGTFAVLALAPVSFLQQIGFSVATGILLAAFVMSMFLVPSLTALIGHAAWWPGHGDVDRRPAETETQAPVAG
ncbi:RND superfamily putative drug exporter [Actinoplanes octamycinicus]|uniref:RND superfamily putative drug exporter n=1 Tax=Actinoplanes octamycinicus TaxID=135948 RepID=A0A7W7H0S9_9ACTN|nr:MMPL family transporter [Actinoplanes octamycinicus]MBB4741734.1 RND superfamily putative drug exporter [Actinoplanes octamycinicus]GIE57288.1 putative membrane protein [Actinoplanes octamycinicus]